MGRTIEGFWDCPYCGQKRIGGLKRKCTNCGASRGEDIKFYMADPTNYISDKKAKEVGKNPDWLCSYCGSYNSDNDVECKDCGATRTESEKNYFEIQKKKQLKEAEENKENTYSGTDVYDTTVEEVSKEDVSEYFDYKRNIDAYNGILEKQDDSFRKNTSIDWKNILQWGGIGLGVISLIVALVFILMPKTQEGTIDAFSWSRSISVEEYKTVDESGWSLPGGARLHYTQEEIRSYKQVIDHYETKTRTYTEQVIDHYEDVVVGHRDNGNGTFEEITSQRPVYRTETRTETYQDPVYRDEPIYDTKYYYEIDKWLHKEYVKTSGKDKKPYWGEYQYGEKEREGNKVEEYKIVVINKDNEENTYTVDYKTWEGLNVGNTVELKVYINGHAELITDETE